MEEFMREQNFSSKLSNLKKLDIEYYLFFIIIEFGEAFNLGSSNKIFSKFVIISIFCLLYKIINTKYTLKELFSILFLVMLGAVIYFNAQKLGGIMSIIAIIGLKGVDTKKLLKISFYIRLITFVFHITLTSFGILESVIIIQNRGNNTLIRNSMGFAHPNQLHLAFVIILLLYMYIYYEKLTIVHAMLFAILNTIVYYKSYSRTSILIGFLAIFLMLWFKSGYFHKIKNVVCIMSIPFFFSISVIVVLLYDKIPNIRYIDRLLQWRITFSKYFLSTYPLNLFGNNLNGDLYILDSGYIELIINYGLVFSILYLLSFLVIVNRCIKKQRDAEVLLIVCFSIYGITEAFIPNLFANLSMILLGDVIFHSSKKAHISQNLS